MFTIVDNPDGTQSAIGTTGDDEIEGAFRDIIGRQGQDTLTASRQVTTELLDGGRGSDSLVGNGGGTQILGGRGNDTLFGAGTDTLSGGNDSDTLQFFVNSSTLATQTLLAGGPGFDSLTLANRVFGADGLLVDLRAKSLSVVRGTDTLPAAIIDGVESVTGSSGKDTLQGTGGRDGFTGSDGDDVLFGFQGKDTLEGGRGADTLEGGSGNDTLAGQKNALFDNLLERSDDDGNLLIGGLGDDVLFSYAADTLRGGQDNDVIFSLAGASLIQGDAGDDLVRFWLRQPDDGLSIAELIANTQTGLNGMVARGGSGFDTLDFAFIETTANPQGPAIVLGLEIDLAAGTGKDRATSGAFSIQGFEDLNGTVRDDILRGDAKANQIFAGSGNDLVEGRRGNDVLNGEGGDNTLRGGNDDDSLIGGEGEDELYGDDGKDTLSGGGSDDALFGGIGADSLMGEAGNDTLRGGDAGDFLSGGLDQDELHGGDGRDTLKGGRFDDTLFGGDKGDTLFGERGNDQLFGGDGNDVLEGGRRDDTLEGGAGDDLMRGGLGRDTFVFRPGQGGTDTIVSFAVGRTGDILDFSNLGISAVDVTINDNPAGSSILIAVNFEVFRIEVLNVFEANYTSDNFMF